ncbi:MAG: hypothetical protein P8N43_11080, partial [Alphaproteobacteria bacterium]|nr:hypothetical protein [Alphaproteobacteria bacterium]
MRLGIWLSILTVACGTEDKLSVKNAHPVAIITSHSDGEVVLEDTTVTLRGSVSDDTDPASDLTTVWLINTASMCEGAPEEDGTTMCEVAVDTDVMTVR